MKNKNYLSGIVFFILFGLFLISCSKSGGNTANTAGTGGSTGYGTPGATVVSIDINGMTFSSSAVTVKVGTTVKWTNSDYYSAHTATSDDGTTFNSGNLATAASYSFTPTAAGTFLYHCNVHTDMKGTLTVTN